MNILTFVLFFVKSLIKMKKIRIGIELDHVIRNINNPIVKYYQQDYDNSVDLDEVDYGNDVLKTVCKFKSKKEMKEFLYELYPLEIFGYAPQMDRGLSRDLNEWINTLSNEEEYDVEIFFYSLKEYSLTIQSTYFFLSKIGSRVRKVIFPKSIDELREEGDIFITANDEVVTKINKPTILIKTKFNQKNISKAKCAYDSFREFLDDKEKLNKIIYFYEPKKEGKASLAQKVKEFFN